MSERTTANTRPVADALGVAEARRAARLEITAMLLSAAALTLAAWVAAPLLLGAPILVALGGHLGVCMLLTVWLRNLHRRGVEAPLAYLGAGFIAFLGPVGVLCTGITAAFWAAYRRNATPFEEWHRSLFPGMETGTVDEMVQLIGANRQRSTGSAEVRPFIDLLRHGTAPQKQAVVALLARKYEPALAGALDMAQADEDPSIRILAASATAAIEQRYLEKWIALSAACEAMPRDYTSHALLAEHLDEYAFSGVLAELRSVDIRTKACEAYLECLRIDPESRSVRFALGRLLMRGGEIEEACEIFTELAQDRIGVGDDDSITVIGYLAECLYALKRYDELRDALEALRRLGVEHPDLPESLRSVAGFWRHDDDLEATKAG